ncbi:MAG: permease, partial [Planctomycetota bacterium]
GVIDWILKALVGGGLRMAEALVACAPTLLVGLFIAGVLRYYIGREGTRKLFGGDSLRCLPQSWAIGMLLPVCSIGVIPILFEMKRAKMKTGAMSAFALSAPLFNPLSLLYGVTLSRPYIILMFAFASLAVVTLVGLIWDRFSRSNDLTETASGDDRDSTAIGIHRIGLFFVYVARQVAGPSGGWALVAGLGVAALAAVLPWGALGSAMGRDDPTAPLSMAGVAIPAYAPPLMVMGQLGLMFQHANSPGAAFVLLVIGAGVNAATIGWLMRQFGIRSVAIWFASLMVIVLSLAYAVNKPLIPPGVNPSGHTHAFDVYSNPVHQLDSSLGNVIRKAVDEKFDLVARIATVFFGGLILFGVVFRILGVKDFGKRPTGDSDLNSDPTVSGDDSSAVPQLKGDRIVSPQVVGGTLIAGLVAISIVMCYAFYPSPEECLEEIRYIRSEVISSVRSGDSEHAKFWIPRWDEWTRRMEVGAFLRSGEVTPYQRMQGFLLRQKLDVLEHELGHKDLELSTRSRLAVELTLSDSRFTRAYRKPFRRSNSTE